MAIRNIIKDGDPILRKTARKVENFDERLSSLIDDMLQTMKLADGVGLAGNQVGVLKRVVVINVGNGDIELVNPVITSSQGEQREEEGCLSFPGESGVTIRPKNVTVKAFDRNGREITLSGEGLLARAFCHEIDHLDGIVFKDRLANMK